MALTYKWFRCIDCGYSGEITTEEIAAHRSKCARGTTEPIAEQARAAEQPDARAWNIVWELAHRDKVFFAGIDGAMARLIEEAQGLLEQPAQPPAANVVERMCSDYGNLTGTDPDPVAMAAALAVAREGYVSLDEMVKMLQEAGFSGAANYLKFRLAKPTERVTVEKFDTPTTLPAIRVLLDGFPQRAFEIDERIHAERYAAGLREELKAGKQ